MKNTLTIILFSIIMLVATSASAQSQGYNTAIGLRLGGLTSGITLKHFISSDAALEGIVSFGSRSFLITGLYEVHNPISGAPGLKWLYGGGAHIGFFNESGSYYTFRNNRVYNNRSVVGLDLILGLDYKFKGAPINMSIDVKPIIDFFDGAIMYFDTGLSVRIAF
ncbi:MAG: hypothetical protein IPM69_09435 [Ignavibacteria bacterium]|nr:hypothetical protein [Ignavibacteria bacterium]